MDVEINFKKWFFLKMYLQINLVRWAKIKNRINTAIPSIILGKVESI